MLNKTIPLSLHNTKLNGGEIASPDKSNAIEFPKQLAKIIEDGATLLLKYVMQTKLFSKK